MPSLALPNPSDTNPGENVPLNPSYPTDGSSQRIAQLRSELQGVRSGIQRIVSGLQGLNEATQQQQEELAAETSLPSFTMSTHSAEHSPPRGSRSIFQGNVQASAWSNIPGPPRDPNFQAVRHPHPPRLIPPRPRLGGQDPPPLRVRQRAYLESDQHRPLIPPPTLPGSHPPTLRDPPTLRSHRRSVSRENPFQALGTREEVERPEYQSPVANMYGNAWGDYRNAGAARQGQNTGAPNVTSTAESHQPTMPNPLMNPPTMPQYTPTYFPNPNQNGVPPYLNPIGLQGIPTPEISPPVMYPSRDNSNASHNRWSLQHLATVTSNRRQQNFNPTDRTNAQTEGTPSHRRVSEARRLAAQRSEEQARSIGRALELAGNEGITARMHYPYTLTGGLAQDILRGYDGPESGSDTESEAALTFDTQDRPPPMDPDSMMLDMSCSICKEHLVDTVVIPCGHAVMCNWCADLHVPGRKHDKTVPKDRSAKCPMCRTRIRHKVSFLLLDPFDLDTDVNSSKFSIHEVRSGLVWSESEIMVGCNGPGTRSLQATSWHFRADIQRKEFSLF